MRRQCMPHAGCRHAVQPPPALGVSAAIPPTAADRRSACAPLSAYPRWARLPRSRRPRRSVILHARRYRRTRVGLICRDPADRGGASFCMRAALGVPALGVGAAIPPTAAERRSACAPLSARRRRAFLSRKVAAPTPFGMRLVAALFLRLHLAVAFVTGVSSEAVGLGAVEAGESGVLRVSVAGWRSGGLPGAASARLSGRRGVYIAVCGIGSIMAVPEHAALVRTTVGVVCARLPGPA